MNLCSYPSWSAFAQEVARAVLVERERLLLEEGERLVGLDDDSPALQRRIRRIVERDRCAQ
jgi:uncharacterized protein YmfQ (DUF2313 family)